MRGILGLAGAVAVAVAVASPAARSEPDLEKCGKAVQRIKACTRLILSGKFSRKDLAILYWNRGNAFVRQQKLKLALADFDDAIKANWRFAYAYYARGLIYQYAMKKRAHAIKDYRMAYDLEPWTNRFADKLLTFGYLVPVRSRL